MESRYRRTATAEAPVEPGWGVYDREGGRVGLVEDVQDDRGTFTIRQAGFGLGVLGGEIVVPQRLIAGTCSDGIRLDTSCVDLMAYSL
jgi:hypothetical protein